METFNYKFPRGRKKQQRKGSTGGAKVLAVILLVTLTSIFPTSSLIELLPTSDSFDYHKAYSIKSASAEEHGYQQQDVVLTTSGEFKQVKGYDADTYHKQLQNATAVFPDIETACYMYEFYSGLNNQLMRFLGILSLAATEGYRQYMEPSLHWKDTYGTSQKISHHKLWDVVHWNTYYPNIPRLVRYDPRYHPHVAESGKVTVLDGNISVMVQHVSFNVTWDIWENRSMTHPAPSGQNRHQGYNQYNQMMKAHDRDNRNAQKVKQFSFYKPMIAGALKPHPFLQQLVDTEKAKLAAGGKYMAFHARVEPDMARQDRVCTTLKVWNITEILDGIYKKFPEPPVNAVLIQFSRNQMEAEVRKTRNIDKYTPITEHNLQVINQLIKEGMWDGRVKVVEAGSSLVREAGDPFYKRYSTIAGGIVNMFLAIESDLFIGTEVSTYSVIAANARFHRGLLENYFYVPEGLKEVARTKQYRFSC